MRYLPIVAVLTLALPAGAWARVPHDPCPAEGVWANGHHLASTTSGLDGSALAHATDHYRVCGTVFKTRFRTPVEAFGPPDYPRCSHYFALRGASRAHHDALHAHWDFWAENGSWVTWAGTGHWRFNPHDGNVVAYDPDLINWNAFAEWPVRIFADCIRTHLPPS